MIGARGITIVNVAGGRMMIRMFNQDCMEAMKEMPDKAYELAIVDPPYGIGKRLSQGAGKLKRMALQRMNSEWDIVPDAGYFSELFRVSENQIIWGGNYFSLPPTRGIICWDKDQPWDNFSAWEMGWTSFDKPAKIFKWCCHAGFIDSKNDSPKIHPTQKPVKLYKWLLNNYAKPGDKILDTHGGSGSICIACDILGYDLDWYELDPDYFAAAKERLERHQQQGVLEL